MRLIATLELINGEGPRDAGWSGVTVEDRATQGDRELFLQRDSATGRVTVGCFCQMGNVSEDTCKEFC